MRQKKKQQMSDEELQRTQVLNFDDFKKIARFEKISSKKPAAIIALVGIFSIMLGASYPAINSMISKNNTNNNNNSTVQARKTDDATSSKLTCSKAITNNPTLNETVDIVYNFENNKLESLTKDFTIISTDASIIEGFKNALPPYLVEQSGYQVSVKEIEGGLKTTTTVDYKTLDATLIPQLNQDNYRFNIDYVKDSLKDLITSDMAAKEYICK